MEFLLRVTPGRIVDFVPIIELSAIVIFFMINLSLSMIFDNNDVACPMITFSPISMNSGVTQISLFIPFLPILMLNAEKNKVFLKKGKGVLAIKYEGKSRARFLSDKNLKSLL